MVFKCHDILPSVIGYFTNMINYTQLHRGYQHAYPQVGTRTNTDENNHKQIHVDVGQNGGPLMGPQMEISLV